MRNFARRVLLVSIGYQILIISILMPETSPLLLNSVIDVGMPPSICRRSHSSPSKIARRSSTSRLHMKSSPDVRASTATPSHGKTEGNRQVSMQSQLAAVAKTIQFVIISAFLAIAIIAWEDISSTHPIRASVSVERHFGSTVRGMAFGLEERQRMPSDMEPDSLLLIPSYNEIMLQHRTKRVPTWSESVSEQDVTSATRTLQMALLQVLECQKLSNDYNWDILAEELRKPVLTSQLDQACDVLNRASQFLSLEERSEIGFDFGSCAWRHCGAFADVREAIDELDHLVGILEPFEANFVLDVVERGLRDMLAMTTRYHDSGIQIPEYQQLQRKSEMNEDLDSPLDVDYLAALEFLKSVED